MEEYLYDIALSYISSLQPCDKHKLYSHFSTAKAILDSSVLDICHCIKRKWKGIGYEPELLIKKAVSALRFIQQSGIEVVRFNENEFPESLLQINDYPSLLYYRGLLQYNYCQSLAIVGTRHPNSEGSVRTVRFAEALTDNEYTIISGLALGIDTIAHKACLQRGGTTFAVLGCGIDQIYPRSNKPLARAIFDKGGVIISEYPPGTPPNRWHFPFRNRILVGLSQAVLVTQSPIRSGSMISAHLARDYSRDLYVTSPESENRVKSGSIDSVTTINRLDEGNMMLIESGGIGVTYPEDILLDRM